MKLHLVELEPAQALGEFPQRGFLSLPAQVAAYRHVSQADENSEGGGATVGNRDREDKENEKNDAVQEHGVCNPFSLQPRPAARDIPLPHLERPSHRILQGFAGSVTRQKSTS